MPQVRFRAKVGREQRTAKKVAGPRNDATSCPKALERKQQSPASLAQRQPYERQRAIAKVHKRAAEEEAGSNRDGPSSKKACATAGGLSVPPRCPTPSSNRPPPLPHPSTPGWTGSAPGSSASPQQPAPSCCEALKAWLSELREQEGSLWGDDDEEETVVAATANSKEAEAKRKRKTKEEVKKPTTTAEFQSNWAELNQLVERSQDPDEAALKLMHILAYDLCEYAEKVREQEAGWPFYGDDNLGFEDDELCNWQLERLGELRDDFKMRRYFSKGAVHGARPTQREQGGKVYFEL